MAASQIYSVISSPYSCFVVLTLLICREVAGYCGTLWESFFWDFLHYAPPYPCHLRCAVYFNTIEPALFAHSARAIFLARAKKYWFRLKIQPESIQTIFMAWGFRRYLEHVEVLVTSYHSPIESMYGRLMLTWMGYIDGKWYPYMAYMDPMGHEL